jgi:predicted alpha/beta hydrolase family esterase
MNDRKRVLIVPGLRDSGPAHWQSLWQDKHPEYVRVSQRHWQTPDLEEWVATLDRAILEAGGTVLIVAHSFGCLAAIERLRNCSDDVAGALLVAPADPLKWGQTPFQPSQACVVPTTLVASRTDPCMDFDKAVQLARILGSDLVDAGDAGHLNAESGHGAWPQGERLLEKLIARSNARERDLRVSLALSA